MQASKDVFRTLSNIEDGKSVEKCISLKSLTISQNDHIKSHFYAFCSVIYLHMKIYSNPDRVLTQ